MSHAAILQPIGILQQITVRPVYQYALHAITVKHVKHALLIILFNNLNRFVWELVMLPNFGLEYN